MLCRINGGYGFLAAHLADVANMGVLALDYHADAKWPAGVRDIVHALKWLRDRGASRLYICGDSSGGTLVVETLLWIAHHESSGHSLNVTVDGAATFSAWLDLTASGESYDSIRFCDGQCWGVGDPVEKEPPGWARKTAMCDARFYAGDDYNQMVVNPMSSPPWLLGMLPPLMLVVGSRDILMGENLAFGQACQSAGAPVQTEVFQGMWHDFVEETHGCGAYNGRQLGEGLTAVHRVGEFFATGASCKVVCSRGAPCSGTAPVNWHFHRNPLPMWTADDPCGS
eukprot:SAG31_NODE_4680_length_3036_cov_1.190671_2_plen_283_part_00